MHHVSHVAEVVTGVAGLLLVAAAILAATKRFRVPFTVVLVLVGIALAQIAQRFPGYFDPLRSLSISPDLILYVFLPTLVFESAFNLDARALRRDIGGVLLLAGPGLLLSTAIIGYLVHWVTPIPLAPALLLGAILSATDPVAVIAVFKQLGAPRRLTTLVDGESLFNDATAIVLSRILIGVMAMGTIKDGVLFDGALQFVLLFVGGLLVGWVLGMITGYLLGKVVDDPAIEITLTTVVAYLSFLMAEDVFHVSGVMAVVAAGVTLGDWGRMRVSPPVRSYLEHFWSYMSFVANALIFLLVGLTVHLPAVWGSLRTLLWVIVAMLASRAIMIYGLTPLIGRMRGGQPIDAAYRKLLYWGGLRGAVALALVLSLPSFEFTHTFVALVTGAVLFTLLVQGLSIEPLMRRLGLASPPLADRMALLESRLVGKQRALARIPELQRGGLFSSVIATRVLQRCERQLSALQSEIGRLRVEQMDRRQEQSLLYLRCFAEEKALFVDMFNKGHLSERAFRELALSLTLQAEALRYQRDFHSVRLHNLRTRRLEHAVLRWLDLLGLCVMVERLRRTRVAVNYEEAWGRYQANGHALEFLQSLVRSESIPAEIFAQVHGSYSHWHQQSQRQLDEMTALYPEFVSAMQERLGRRVVLIAEQEVLKEQAEQGTLPSGMADKALYAINHDLNDLRGQEPSRLVIGPKELLRKVPFFREFPVDEFAAVAKSMRPHTVSENEVIVRQGDAGDSLFLIARGVVRISSETDGVIHDLATLMAGDFIGEMALLHREPRSATARAVTPATLYELGRQDLNSVIAKHPTVRTALQEIDRRRQELLAGGVEHPA